MCGQQSHPLMLNYGISYVYFFLLIVIQALIRLVAGQVFSCHGYFMRGTILLAWFNYNPGI